jgi:hypothetical protein
VSGCDCSSVSSSAFAMADYWRRVAQYGMGGSGRSVERRMYENCRRLKQKMKPNERRKTVLGNKQLYQLLRSAVGGVVECLEVTSAVGWLASGQAKRSASQSFLCLTHPVAGSLSPLLTYKNITLQFPLTSSLTLRVFNADTVMHGLLVSHTRHRRTWGVSWNQTLPYERR